MTVSAFGQTEEEEEGCRGGGRSETVAKEGKGEEEEVENGPRGVEVVECDVTIDNGLDFVHAVHRPVCAGAASQRRAMQESREEETMNDVLAKKARQTSLRGYATRCCCF